LDAANNNSTVAESLKKNVFIVRGIESLTYHGIDGIIDSFNVFTNKPRLYYAVERWPELNSLEEAKLYCGNFLNNILTSVAQQLIKIYINPQVFL
jgi:hypothetical protein